MSVLLLKASLKLLIQSLKGFHIPAAVFSSFDSNLFQKYVKGQFEQLSYPYKAIQNRREIFYDEITAQLNIPIF